MQIRDLEQWPPSVWVTTGSTRLMPNLSTATIKNSRADGKFVRLRVEDQGQEYPTTLVFSDGHLARQVNYTLKKAIRKTIQDSAQLVVEEIRYIHMEK
jgi:hypothetical protein